MHRERDRTPRLVDAGKQAAPGSGIGLDGGKTLDTAKAVRAHFAVSLVICAMAASMDAPTSARAIIYNDRCGALRSQVRVLGAAKESDMIMHNVRVLHFRSKRQEK